ncbi:hypothetical protein BT63DRAFT_290213 [Microthyrium microscopicum]|uniref:Vesicle-mediated transport protein Vid24 n=1 Tax=Microthyrium microscopicum TaxID=703497 RepID=A0A6A6U8B5_9PEZI|nr:hypothetical protein BT63DRAFT_290213 [Microthyrium microscopicum]
MPTEHEPPVLAQPQAEASGRSFCPPSFDNTSSDSLSEPDTSQTEPMLVDSEDPPKSNTQEIEEPIRDTPTPVSSIDEGSANLESEQHHSSHGLTSSEPPVRQSSTADLLCEPFRAVRFRPNSSSSFLKPGARFSGIQRSDKAEYEVVVDIQHVDMEDSYLCGYLKIRGLTEAHPSLTTYFEGEMIGTKYSFVTQHPEWGANEKTDWQHWGRFPQWRPIQKDARKPNFVNKNWMQKENIWMRWKEHFLVPDHTVRHLPDASFDGFYYICFNQKTGTITGAYYHARSDRFQHLELKPTNIHPGFEMGFEFR